VAKRVFDLCVAAVGLVVLSPVLVVIGLLVKATSRGPVLFRQSRIGRNGRPFAIYKFRTMRALPGGPALTIGADRRITSVGRVLRAYKLDELPQLFNVLRGEMSLVGPRPEVPEYVAVYPSDVKQIVLSVRPGITDPASIEFRDESEQLGRQADPERFYVEDILPRKLAAYVAYVRGRSFFGDLRLIVATLRAIGGGVPSHKGR
jgi:lipopolysaccharide/colanic/teichoic acid biosynthesis glycosyltransferase